MKVFTKDYRMESNFPRELATYFDGMKPCVLDIETTGLSSANSKIILVGLLTQSDAGIRTTQFLAENHYEEHKVLEATVDFLKSGDIDYLITYNGLSFDLPFINSRIEQTFTGDPVRMYHFDLYRFIKLATDLKSRIGSLRQMAVEDYYGIFSDRNDTITGRESVAMFDEYSLTGNSTLEKIILTHNREDIVQLHRLMHLVTSDIDDMDSAMASYGFPVMCGALSVRPTIKKNRGNTQEMLRICGDQIKSPVSAAFFPDIDNPVTAIFNAETAMFEIELPVERFPDNVLNFGLSEDNDSEFESKGKIQMSHKLAGNSHNPQHYIDVKSLGLDFADDPDCINGYLVLTPRTINNLSAAIVKQIIEKAGAHI